LLSSALIKGATAPLRSQSAHFGAKSPYIPPISATPRRRLNRYENVDIEALLDFSKLFESLEDKRFQPYVEHLLSDIVMITLIGVLSNANEWSEIAAFARAKEG
jgi:hypothetical protein